MCTGGYMVHEKTFNPIWRYTVQYVNYEAYVFQAMMVNEFAHRTYSCATDDGTQCSCVYETPIIEACSMSGHHVLRSYDIEIDGFATRLVAVLIIIMVLRILAWLVLRLRRYR
jgi:hypothetical protein